MRWEKSKLLSLTHSLTHLFVRSFIHSFIHSFTHSLTHSFTHSFICRPSAFRVGGNWWAFTYAASPGVFVSCHPLKLQVIHPNHCLCLVSHIHRFLGFPWYSLPSSFPRSAIWRAFPRAAFPKYCSIHKLCCVLKVTVLSASWHLPDLIASTIGLGQPSTFLYLLDSLSKPEVHYSLIKSKQDWNIQCRTA